MAVRRLATPTRVRTSRCAHDPGARSGAFEPPAISAPVDAEAQECNTVGADIGHAVGAIPEANFHRAGWTVLSRHVRERVTGVDPVPLFATIPPTAFDRVSLFLPHPKRFAICDQEHVPR